MIVQSMPYPRPGGGGAGGAGGGGGGGGGGGPSAVQTTGSTSMPVGTGGVWQVELFALESFAEGAAQTPTPLRMYRPYNGYPGQAYTDELFPELTAYAGNWYHWDGVKHPDTPLPSYPYPNSDEADGGSLVRSGGIWTSGDPSYWLTRYAKIDQETFWEPGYLRKKRVRTVRFTKGATVWDDVTPDQDGTYSVEAFDYTNWYFPSFNGVSGSRSGTFTVPDMTGVVGVEVYSPLDYWEDVIGATDSIAGYVSGAHGDFDVYQPTPGNFTWTYTLWGNAFTSSKVEAFPIRVRYADGSYSTVTSDTTITITLQFS